MAEAKPDEGKKKLDPVFLGVLVFALINIIGLAGGAFVVFKYTLGWQPPVVDEKELRALLTQHHKQIDEAATPKTTPAVSLVLPSFDELQVRLDPVTANLDGNPQRVIKIGMTLKVLDPQSFEEVMDPLRVPKIKDSILRVLQSTNFSDIESLQGKLFLKDRLIKEINPLLVQGVVREIYFNELVVQ